MKFQERESLSSGCPQRFPTGLLFSSSIDSGQGQDDLIHECQSSPLTSQLCPLDVPG